MQKEINVTKEGSLSSLINRNEIYEITDLKLRGSLNGTDIKFIRDIIEHNFDWGNPPKGKLKNLDLSKVNILKSEDSYFQMTEIYNKNKIVKTYKTENNRITSYMFCSTALKNVVLPINTMAIDNDAFFDCIHLEYIEIPDKTHSIGRNVFCNCTRLSRITIPCNVTNIGEGVFSNCSLLSKIYTQNPIPPQISGNYLFYWDGSISDNEENGILYVPFGSLESYRNADGWKKFQNIIEI